MSKPMGIKKQLKLIRLVLAREFPNVDFTLHNRLVWDDKCNYWGSRHGEVNFDASICDVTVADVQKFLKRFEDTPRVGDNHGYLRTYWVNDKGNVTLARVRKLFEDNSTKLSDSFDPPKDGTTYTYQRFQIQNYVVNDTSKVPERDYIVF